MPWRWVSRWLHRRNPNPTESGQRGDIPVSFHKPGQRAEGLGELVQVAGIDRHCVHPRVRQALEQLIQIGSVSLPGFAAYLSKFFMSFRPLAQTGRALAAPVLEK